MKKILLTLTLVFCGICAINAQSTTDDSEKKIQDRISYMKEHLKLNASEANAFWTEYEKFVRTEMSYVDAFKKNLKNKKIKYDPRNKETIEYVSSEQITYMMDQRMELKKNLNTLESNFYKKIKGILTPRHLYDFYTLDEQFKRTVVAQKNKAATQTQKNAANPGMPAQSKSRR